MKKWIVMLFLLVFLATTLSFFGVLIVAEVIDIDKERLEGVEEVVRYFFR